MVAMPDENQTSANGRVRMKLCKGRVLHPAARSFWATAAEGRGE